MGRINDRATYKLAILLGCVLAICSTCQAQINAGHWASAGNLNTARTAHTATLQLDGTTLLAGGTDNHGNAFGTAEIYNPTTGAITTTTIGTPRFAHTGTLLIGGGVLLTGGVDSSSHTLNTAVIYKNGSISSVGNLNTPRNSHTATLLKGAALLPEGNEFGAVLITGGASAWSNTIGTNFLSSAELYDPFANTFAVTGSMSTPRSNHTATQLNNGLVLVAGGFGNGSAELYNPATGTFSLTGSMSTVRAAFTATLLPDGTVLMTGGISGSGAILNSAEIYNPVTGAFTAVGNLNHPRCFQTATLLDSGMVLIAAGFGGSDLNTPNSAELYNPTTKSFLPTGSLSNGRASHTATLLINGTVLVAGGDNNIQTSTGPVDSAIGSLELYTPLQPNVVTERYDNGRTGANLNETQLTPSAVSSNFGKLWSYLATGSVYAQPLYVQNVNIPGQGVFNVLYVVTMDDWVYAFNADSSSNIPLWSDNLQGAGVPVPVTDIASGGNIIGNIGIESTPVIDLTTNTMYLVARTKESGSPCGTVNGNYCQRLHALDITTGAEKFGGPKIIEVTIAVPPSQTSTLTFDPKIENQRASLALDNGQVYIAWASHQDQNAYHGWIMSYNASNIQALSGVFCSTPNGSEGGIWMAGHAPAIDANGNIYYMVGNGTFDGANNFGESLIKFSSVTPLFPVVDHFTPSDWSALNGGDLDFGASGPLLIPGTDLIIGAGKSTVTDIGNGNAFYMMHKDDLGQLVQSLLVFGSDIRSGPIYWNRSGGPGPWMYVWGDDGDSLKAYHFNGATFDVCPPLSSACVASQSSIVAPSGKSGAVLTLSANGGTPGSGIVWASMPSSGDGENGVQPGILRAFNADNLSQELWDSSITPTRDNMGNWPKFNPPTVANGRVYMASFTLNGNSVSNSTISVYGLNPPPPPSGGGGGGGGGCPRCVISREPLNPGH